MRKILKLWNTCRVYIVSCIIILLVLLIMLYVKKYWPFGSTSLLTGDFIHQGWSYSVTLRNKILSGDSLFYTWNGGYGVNFLTNIQGYCNPFLFVFILFPESKVLQVGTITFILTLLLCNCSMLYFLTHRPYQSLDGGKFENMLFSLPYALCTYVIANLINWHFLATAVLFPIIILGLEQYVYERRWRLYTITLAFSFFTSIYFTGLFCFFIILYYLTLNFKSFKDFLLTSLKIMGFSMLSIGLIGIVFAPEILHMKNLDYTVSSYSGDIWFGNYFDVIQTIFAFNTPIGMGSSSSSYGEVSLYFGLLPLMLATMYFFQREIPFRQRIRRFLVFALYMVAFDCNPLNYVMHFFHYPTWFPNRFSWFFDMYCIILAYEAWIVIRRNKRYRVLPAVVSGILWIVLAAVSYYGTDQQIYTFVYTYSAIILGVYLLLLLMRSFSYKIVPRLLVILGCLEIAASFSYSLVYHRSGADISLMEDKIQILSEEVENAIQEEENGFSRVLTESSSVGTDNVGFLMNYKSPTIFSGSMNNLPLTMLEIGVVCSGNYMTNYLYTPVTLSLLNNQYIISDYQVYHDLQGDWISSTKLNAYDEYPVKYEEEYIKVFENEDVLALGYMIDQEIDLPLTSENMLNQNIWVEQISGVSDVFEEADLHAVKIEPNNCQAILMGHDLIMAHDMPKDMFVGLETLESDALCKIEGIDYDKTQDSEVLITYEAEQEGMYYIKCGYRYCYLGKLAAGEQRALVAHMTDDYYENNIFELNLETYVLNYDKWKQARDYLAEHQLQVEEYFSDYVMGTINTDREGLMFTSIPYDENWHAYVDGAEVEIQPLNQNGFVGVMVPEGTHKIEFRYRQRHLGIGGGVSLVSIVILIVIGQIERRKCRKKEAAQQ